MIMIMIVGAVAISNATSTVDGIDAYISTLGSSNDMGSHHTVNTTTVDTATTTTMTTTAAVVDAARACNDSRR